MTAWMRLKVNWPENSLNRRSAIQLLGKAGLALTMNKVSALDKLSGALPASNRMPVIFSSHGNPMDITLPAYGNDFLSYLGTLGQELRRKYPIKAIMVISAHWLTQGTYINVSARPETVFDYYNFPPEYYASDLKYPAKGAPGIARQIAADISDVTATSDWGLDHGCWPMLRHLFPEADIPVFQLSIDYYQTPQYHFELASKLKRYRDQGILIIGSGAIVHNLNLAGKRMFAGDTRIYGWDKEFDDFIKQQIDDRNVTAIIEYEKHKYGKMAAPTPDHYVPLIYSMALIDDKDEIKHTYEGLLPAFSDRSFIAEPKA